MSDLQADGFKIRAGKCVVTNPDGGAEVSPGESLSKVNIRPVEGLGHLHFYTGLSGLSLQWVPDGQQLDESSDDEFCLLEGFFEFVPFTKEGVEGRFYVLKFYDNPDDRKNPTRHFYWLQDKVPDGADPSTLTEQDLSYKTTVLGLLGAA